MTKCNRCSKPAVRKRTRCLSCIRWNREYMRKRRGNSKWKRGGPGRIPVEAL